ncbi:MAG: dihydroorotase [Burkholderiales bacterium]
MSRITITRPDDWHLHLRDADHMRAVLPDTARRFARAIVMPNLKLPVTTTEQAAGYRERILSAVPEGVRFEPLMTLYLTDNTTGKEIRRAKASGLVHGVKYYPAGATTNSEAGVSELIKCEDALAVMEECGMPLLVHGEVTFPNVDIFDREKIFIDRVLLPVLQKFPKLRVVFEHITTKEAVRFVLGAPPRVAATITAHHLLLNRNALFAGGIRPHHYCLPILKREDDRLALIDAATSGNPKFFLGTDSAPHARDSKEATCGCAGMYTAHAGIEFYAEIFGAYNALDKLEGFASVFGPLFYGLPRNQDKITLVKEVWNVPGELPFHNDKLVPFRAGGTVAWRML